MEPERIELSTKERDRLKVLHEVEQGHLKPVEAARRLRLSYRQVRRLQARLRAQGDGAIVHGLRGRRSNRKMPEILAQRALRVLRRERYRGFGPTLAAEHLARQGLSVSRETLRQWMSRAGLWRPRSWRVKAVHVWRPRRAGGNSQPAGGAHRGCRSHRELAGATLGPAARRRLRGNARRARGDRKALGWQSLAASPQPLSAA